MHSSITKFYETETRKSNITTRIEEIQLVWTQIQVLIQRYEQCANPERKAKYRKGLIDLQEKFDVQLMALLID